MKEHRPQITDRFGRIHDYLRISLTERCNLRCFYCMPEEGIELRDKTEFMTAEELIQIAKKFVDLGVKKIRLTGGEPLIKKNAAFIIQELGKLPVELAITTNAVVVDRFINVFKDAGIQSVNVSLDSLDETRFNDISRRNYFKVIRKNIDALIANKFTVKINVVVIRNINEHEIIDFVRWSHRENVHIRFIEFMPFDGNHWKSEKKVSFDEILKEVSRHLGADGYHKISDAPNDTSKNFRVSGGLGTFGIISSITNPFCDTCNRIRLTADGKIKNCLFSEKESDLLRALREGHDLEQLIRSAVEQKFKERGGLSQFSNHEVQSRKNRAMTSIGG
ncbi:GTP 3',8-cyclase MoaA [Crocinitomicaceae bacterium]|nr:GTP 3',8-cyclase MoaA [Crocinitomicaceae bacterium]